MSFLPRCVLQSALSRQALHLAPMTMPIPTPELASEKAWVEECSWGDDGSDDCASEDPVEPLEEVFLNALVRVVWEEQFLGAR